MSLFELSKVSHFAKPLDYEEVYLVSIVSFLPLTAKWALQLVVPTSCEWEETYPGNKVYFLLN